MSTIGLYFHTLRYLRPLQIVARLSLPLRRPRVDLRPAPARRAMPRAFEEPAAPAPSMTAPDTFRFLNVERHCAKSADWNPHDAEKLWVYNLHYFDDLNAVAADSRCMWHVALLDRWVAENSPGIGIGWEPYPTSRRIVNWVKWSARNHALPSAAIDSLAVQARWLAGSLEYHILGNHLFANAKALLYAGAYFTGPEAERWLSKGMSIVSRELREQVLDDGGHFELSPMYHALILEDLLDLINVQQAYGLPVPQQWQDTAVRMLRWLRSMNQPDGDVPFFNDSAFGISPRCDDLDRYSERLGLRRGENPPEGLLALPDSGYVRMTAGRAYVVCDCAEVGPSYQPGHAHADTLSFEFSLDARRVFVNSGTSCYGLSAERRWQRSTAAHNTVVVDSADSSEVWAGFRVARRARPTIREISTDEQLAVDASHDGYLRLPGRNEHRRRWELSDGLLYIEDRVTGSFKTADAFFHMHPDVKPGIAEGRKVVLYRLGAPLASVEFEGARDVDIATGHWHPAFGIRVKNHCIRVGFGGQTLSTRVRWASTA